jgi:creatinine amidohydrolase
LLALAPDQVHLDRIPGHPGLRKGDPEAIRRKILDRGVTWPWTSDDPVLAALGISGGDLRTATAQLGNAIIDSAVAALANTLDAL